MKLTASQLKDIQRDNIRWPVIFTEIPRDKWQQNDQAAMLKSGNFDDQVIKVWRSRHFLVQLYHQTSAGDIHRLSVQRTDYDNKTRRFRDGITWNELMKVKAEVGYGDHCALEVYPPDNLVVDVANIRHLFLLPPGQIPSFVWR